ncbi:RadC family protein [Coprobacter tertius]|uniref:DNA repair protein RadC n=1 Tax=Coprobacter tertius TaxID=2944915 RepID=A0ABT1MGI4_9BACT|nr:DNA repair protein RadC [Coprobacter tertius]MCP9610793.1 DNA repair protein RadC [Coprobacter tertius]
MNCKEKLSISRWAEEDRPREKMLSKGIKTLTNAELIAILIGSGNIRESAVELSQRILNSVDDSLNQLGKLSVNDLTEPFDGIGQAKAISIIAALELGRRRKSEEIVQRKKITCSEDAYRLLYASLVDLPYEEFWVIFLNPANRILCTQKVSQGGTSFTSVDVKLVLKPAIEKQASSIVLCHNHPSNNRQPSQADRQLTKKIKEGAALLDIRILDHIIVCDDGYYSFADEGII